MLVQLLVLYLHPALWRVIPMLMTSKPTSTAWHHKLILQFNSSNMPQTPLMHGSRLINRLHLHPQKSQYIWFGTRQQLDKLDLAAFSLEFPTFVFSTSVQNLGSS